MKITEALNLVTEIVNKGITLEGTQEILKVLQCPFDMDVLEEMVLYSEYLPANNLDEYNTEIKYLHFLWDVLDKTPMAIVANFAIPFRRILAQKMFKKCSKNVVKTSLLKKMLDLTYLKTSKLVMMYS